jgi:hypothetical protein
MLTRQSLYIGRPAWLKTPGNAADRTGGRQIDWANVDADDYTDPASGKKIIPSGTAMGTLLGSGKMSPRVVTTNPAVGLLEGDAIEDDLVHSISGYGLMVGGTVYENLLPDATGGPPATLAAGIKTELQANCPRGWQFEVYQDTR